MVSLFFRKRFIIILTFGATEMAIILLEARLALTCKRPSYRPTGRHPSPRSVLVWRSAIRRSSLWSISMPTLCTHWLLTEHIALLHWVVTRGRRSLVHRPRYNATATRKGSMLWALVLETLKQESALLATSKMTATAVIPESGLEQEDILMTSTRVETRQNTHQIMETNTSKPWVTSWCSKTNSLLAFKAKHILLFS